MKIALWAENLAYPVASLTAWVNLVEEQVILAKEEGAKILLMPEYSSIHWLHFFSPDLSGPEQLEKAASLSEEAIKRMSDLAKKHDILLISGTFPVPRADLDPPFSNRAHIHFPDGRLLFQDKLCLTPFEKDPEDWNLSPGDTLSIFEWEGYRMAVMICLDIELPALSSRISALHLDLILVPSMTSNLSGYHRVFDCAKARTIELLTSVAAVGVIGAAPGVDAYTSGASIFVPCEESFGYTGTLARISPVSSVEGKGPLLVKDIPLQEIQKMRKSGKAEVWPGSWNADHVQINSC